MTKNEASRIRSNSATTLARRIAAGASSDTGELSRRIVVANRVNGNQSVSIAVRKILGYAL